VTAIVGRRPLLVTGGAGFIGCNLADRLAAEGHDVLVFDSLGRPGVAENLHWLRRRHPRRVTATIADLRDGSSLGAAVRASGGVFHLAAQVAVTTSLADPIDDFETNVCATVHLLEAARHAGGLPVIFASTNKVYGDLADLELACDDAWHPVDATARTRGIGEDRKLDFHTPYGCSKGAADQYVLDYARSYALPTCVFRMSCIYGPRQRGTEDQGWLAHFVIAMLQGEPITLYGDGYQVRDVLFVEDAVAAYLAAWRRLAQGEAPGVAGTAFNLGGGPANAVTLRQAIAVAEAATGTQAELHQQEWRPGDQRWFVADVTRARETLGLAAPLGWQEGIARLAAWLQEDGMGARRARLA
jgi:CDP-paratose 2-epimerase